MTDTIFCIDPGPVVSGAVNMTYDGTMLDAWPEIDNHELLRMSLFKHDAVVIEMIASYGMGVGQNVFETCVWIGRFLNQFGENRCHRIFRLDVKLNLCHAANAADTNIRHAILDRYSPTGGGKTPQVGTKKQPGPLYGVSKHAWAALAVGLTYLDGGAA